MADLLRWTADLKAEVDKAATQLGQRVAGIVSGRVPHLTGQLAGSVQSDLDDDGIAISLGDGLDYAGWIEFGGSRGRSYIPEGRYLFPSLQDSADEYQQLAESAAAQSVGSFHWSKPPQS